MTQWYYEIAIGSPTSRGSLVAEDEIPKIVAEHGQNTAIYRSVYLYPEEAVSIINEDKSVKNWFGIRWIKYIPIDIDKGSDTDEECKNRAIHLVNILENKYGLDERHYAIYFSGTGYHIDIAADVFGFEPDTELPYIVKETINSLFKDADLSIYSRTGLYRINNTKSQKSGLYKTLITKNDLEMLTPTAIKELCTEHSRVYDDDTPEDVLGELIGNRQLNCKIVKAVPAIRTYNKVLEPVTVATCTQTIYNQGPQRGSRNLSLLRLASHYKRCGIPSSAAIAALLHWNNGSLNETTVIENIENVYNRNYKYGCEDAILKQYCSTRCVYYKNKNYTAETYNFDDMQKALEDFAKEDWNGRCINLAALLGMPDKDCIIYPGELVSVYGPTGSGKTAMVQHLIMGISFVDNSIQISQQMDALYLSLELHQRLMHRRNMQIAGGFNKRWIMGHLNEASRITRPILDHIHIRTLTENIRGIDELIRQLAPKVVVVDYLDLVDSNGRSEHEKLKEIAHGLSALAVKYDIIIIAVAQVKRDDARQQLIDLYSGKGSGAIENASRKVIGINGQAGDPIKKIEIFKNTDGELLPPITMRQDPDNFRLKVVEHDFYRFGHSEESH